MYEPGEAQRRRRSGNRTNLRSAAPVPALPQLSSLLLCSRVSMRDDEVGDTSALQVGKGAYFGRFLNFCFAAFFRCYLWIFWSFCTISVRSI